MAAQNRDLNIVVLKLFSPRFQLAGIAKQLGHRTMLIIGISAGPNFRGFHSHAGVLLDQLIEPEIGKRRVENSDGNLPARPGGSTRFVRLGNSGS